MKYKNLREGSDAPLRFIGVPEPQHARVVRILVAAERLGGGKILEWIADLLEHMVEREASIRKALWEQTRYFRVK